MSDVSNIKLNNDIWEGIENDRAYFKSDLIKEINKEACSIWYRSKRNST